MDQTHNDPVVGGRGVEGSSTDVFKNGILIDQTKAAAKRPVVTGIRRGPGGVAKPLKAEWLVSLENVCAGAPIRDRHLRSYGEFCTVFKRRYGISFAPIAAVEWAVIVEAAIAAGGAS